MVLALPVALVPLTIKLAGVKVISTPVVVATALTVRVTVPSPKLAFQE